MINVPDASFAFALVLSAAALIWAAGSDLFRYLIPNRVCALVAAGYAITLVALPAGAWLTGLATGFAVLLLGAALFAKGWLGGGDVKLAAAIALWAGPTFFYEFTFVTAAAGAALATLMLTPLRRLMPRPPGVSDATGFRQPMPFGVPLAAGGVWVLALQYSTNL